MLGALEVLELAARAHPLSPAVGRVHRRLVHRLLRLAARRRVQRVEVGEHHEQVGALTADEDWTDLPSGSLLWVNCPDGEESLGGECVECFDINITAPTLYNTGDIQAIQTTGAVQDLPVGHTRVCGLERLQSVSLKYANVTATGKDNTFRWSSQDILSAGNDAVAALKNDRTALQDAYKQLACSD